MSLSYCPWSDIGRRYPNVHVGVHDIAPARAAWVDDAQVVFIDRRLSRVEGRSALAHEIAHIDLGHEPRGMAWFDTRQEREATALAARRLISVDRFVEAFLWCRDDRELAAELQVDVPTLRARREAFTATEVSRIEYRIATIETAA